MELSLNSNCFELLSTDECFLVTGGWNWDAFADCVLGVGGAAAIIGTAFPPANAVALVCGSYYVGYKAGKAIFS